MFDTSLQTAREALEGRRVALVEAIAVLDRLLETDEPPATVAPARVARVSKLATPTRAKTKARRPGAAVRTSGKAPRSEPTIERDEAILDALRRNDGMAVARDLQRAMPKESGLTDEQRDAAYRNSMSRLKARGLIGRTGDTWSLVGRGSE